MLGVEQWAELRRLHAVEGLSIREIGRRTGLHRATIRRALSSEQPPRYTRTPAGSKLDPFKDEIHRLLHDNPQMPNMRICELIAPLGYRGHQTRACPLVRALQRDTTLRRSRSPVRLHDRVSGEGGPDARGGAARGNRAV